MFGKLVPFVLAAVLGATGCYPAGGVAYTRAGFAVTPDLVPVGGGVSVIANYGEPIFFANNFYWWPTSRGWYRSRRYTGGWQFDPRPPVAVARIQSPYRYRNFRPPNYVVRRRPVPVQRIDRPRVNQRATTIRTVPRT